MKLIASKILVAFKPRPRGIIPGEGLEPRGPRPQPRGIPPPSDFGIHENQGELPNEIFKFNAATGIPPQIEAHGNEMAKKLAGQPILPSNHSIKQSQGGDSSHLLGFEDLPHLEGGFPKPEHGFKPVEIEVSKTPAGGSRIHKLLMRGPLNPGEDAVMPVIFRPKQTPLVSTMWRNKQNDNHRTLDMRRVHLPEEFAHGKSPTRRLATADEARSPGYVPLHSDNQKARAEIIRKHGIA